MMKRIAGLMMCLVMVIGCLSGCGGKTDEALLSGSVKTLNEAKNYDVTSKTTGKMKVAIGGMSQDVDISSDVKGTQFAEPFKAKMTANTTTAGTTITMETYMAKENDKYAIYMKVNNEWSKMSLGDLEQAMAASGMSSLQEQLSEDTSKYVKKDDIEEKDKKYLVYDYTVSGDEIKNMMKNVTSSMGSILGAGQGSIDTEKLLNDMVKDIGDITMTILIDRDSETIYQVRYSMAEMMNKMMDSLMKSVAEIAKEEAKKNKDAGVGEEDLDQTFSSMKIEVDSMDMVISYSNIGSAADFEIPKEALEAEEISLDDTAA